MLGQNDHYVGTNLFFLDRVSMMAFIYYRHTYGQVDPDGLVISQPIRIEGDTLGFRLGMYLDTSGPDDSPFSGFLFCSCIVLL